MYNPDYHSEDGQTDTVDMLVRQARQHYLAGENEAAIELLSQAEQLANQQDEDVSVDKLRKEVE